jgi:hypothetical protein
MWTTEALTKGDAVLNFRNSNSVTPNINELQHKFLEIKGISTYKC